MLHHSLVVNIKGPSWRSKESDELNRRQLQKANQSHQPGSPDSAPAPVDAAPAPPAAAPDRVANIRTAAESRGKAKKTTR